MSLYPFYHAAAAALPRGGGGGLHQRSRIRDAYRIRPILWSEVRKLLGLSSTLIRATARVLLLTLSVTTVGPVLHGSHDEELQSPVVNHEESQHQIQAAQGDERGPLDQDHCVACHFVRSSRGPISWEPAGLLTLARGARLVHSDGPLSATPDAAPAPSRAPPVHA